MLNPAESLNKSALAGVRFIATTESIPHRRVESHQQAAPVYPAAAAHLNVK